MKVPQARVFQSPLTMACDRGNSDPTWRHATTGVVFFSAATTDVEAPKRTTKEIVMEHLNTVFWTLMIISAVGVAAFLGTLLAWGVQFVRPTARPASNATRASPPTTDASSPQPEQVI